MKMKTPWPGRGQFSGVLLWLLALAAGLSPRLEAAKFNHASLGPIEIYTSDGSENTKRLLCELLEARRQIAELVAPVPLPNPRMQIVIFSKSKDYEEFLPDKTVLQSGRTTVAYFTSSDYGLVVSTVMENDFGYDFGRDTLVFYYASYLLQSAVPDAPLWVKAGLPEFFASTSCRGNKLYVGGDFMEHRTKMHDAKKLMPLEKLMDDAQMEPYFGVARHDNDFYHESWGLWQQWLANPDPHRRAQVNRLFTAIRAGRKGDFATVVESFGETADAIEAAHRAPKTARGFSPLMANADAASLVPGLVFAPATDLERRFAQAMLVSASGKGPGALGYELYRLGEANPTSARPAEALAVLAMGEKDYPAAAVRWEKARELGTDNLYAYLLPAQQALASRSLYLSLQPQLAETLCGPWREYLARCTALDPACADAHYYRVLLEAFAEKPDQAGVDAADRSQALAVRPMGYLYLAIARWRLGQTAEAHRLLANLREYSRLAGDWRAKISALDSLMRRMEAKKE